MAALMNADPATSRVVVADDKCPEAAEYIDNLIAHLDRPGRVPTTGLADQVIETGTPLFIPSMAFNDFLSLLRPETKAYMSCHPPPDAMVRGPIGVLLVPMRSRGATVGTLGLFDRQSTGPLPAEYADWLQGVADRIGAAIENAQLYVSAVGRLDRLQALQSIGLAVLASQDLRLTLQVILEIVSTCLGVDAADIALVDEARGALFIAASAGFHSSLMPEFRFPVDAAVFGDALQGRRFDSMAELESLGAFRRRSLFAREGFQTYRGIPLLTRNRLRGVLEIFHRGPLDPDGEWVGFLEAIATLTAIAIDYAAMITSLQSIEGTSSMPRVRQPAPDLSRAEKEVLRHVVEGLSNHAIGEQLHITESTVKFHVRRLLQKSQVENRTELARKATREGWI